MAAQNNSKTILDMNCPNSFKSKVFINPNFNRPQINIISNNPIMHVNPKFSHLVTNVECKIQNNTKIYLNPNFMKSRGVCEKNIHYTSSSLKHQVIPDEQSIVLPVDTNQQLSIYKEVAPPQVPLAQSRYSLIRQNVASNNKPVGQPIDKAKTFKLNKYKTVPWVDMKRTLENEKQTKNHSTYTNRINFKPSVASSSKAPCLTVPDTRKNKFKLINYENVSPIKPDRIKTKMYTETQIKLYKSNPACVTRVKIMKSNLKKNNIPCPLFRKFGKCLREARGKCEFLHDKNHVSICRKFIKGLCHDKDCLLSHDLTTKKMPTCYFYLQGTCTKTECPYLHVKLNEKTKVCADFVKGYCEKGSKCLQRHISVSTKKNKRSSLIKTPKNRNNELLKIRRQKNNNPRLQDEEVELNVENKSENNAKSHVVNDDNYSESRYYQEHLRDGNINESCEVIKPMRCKLGTLPSFIQL